MRVDEQKRVDNLTTAFKDEVGISNRIRMQFYTSSQREGGQFYHEGDKCAFQLPGQTGGGESQHRELPGAYLDESEE